MYITHQIFKKYKEFVKSSDTTSLSYYLIVSLVPAATLITWTASFLDLDPATLLSLFEEYFQADTSNQILDALFNHNVDYLSISTIVMSLYVISKGIYNMTIVANRLYGLEPFEMKQKIKKQILSYFQAALFILMVISILIVLAVVPSILSFLDFTGSYTLISFSVLYLIIFSMMIVLNMYLPYLRLKIKDVIKGSLFSTTGIIVFLGGFNLYLSYANYTTIYGPLAHVVILLLLLNIIANLIYIGIAINAQLYDNKYKDWETL